VTDNDKESSTLCGDAILISSFDECSVVNAHRHCALHFDEIQRSDYCGCFHCTAIFAPKEIDEWIDDRRVSDGTFGKTAMCPKCGIDSVIGSASTFPITAEFLSGMRSRWFGK